MNVAGFVLTRCRPKSVFGFCDAVDGSCNVMLLMGHIKSRAGVSVSVCVSQQPCS